MRHNYRSHGRHCYLRSFQTKCRKCGANVLYWECTHGSKLFFEYPPYGKLVRHYCRKAKGKTAKTKYPVIVKRPQGLLNKASPSCPVCGKLFKNEKDVAEHLKQLKSSDNLHKLFLESKLYIKNKDLHKNKTYNDSPKFGQINIKKKNKEK